MEEEEVGKRAQSGEPDIHDLSQVIKVSISRSASFDGVYCLT